MSLRGLFHSALNRTIVMTFSSHFIGCQWNTEYCLKFCCWSTNVGTIWLLNAWDVCAHPKNKDFSSLSNKLDSLDPRPTTKKKHIGIEFLVLLGSKNGINYHLKCAPSLETFKSRVKTHLFQQFFYECFFCGLLDYFWLHHQTTGQFVTKFPLELSTLLPIIYQIH